MRKSIARRGRWLAGIATVAGLLWLVGCRTQTQQFAVPAGPPITVPPPGLPPGTPPPPIERAPDPYPAGPNAPASGQDTYVKELLDILKDTKSVDSFIVTLGMIVDAKPDHRQVVPVVIRNAERLGIYAQRILKDESGPSAEAFTMVNNAIEKLVPHAKGAATPTSAPKRGRVVPAGPTEPDGNQTKIYLPEENATPVLPPIPPGQRPVCANAPDHAAILRSMSRAERGVHGVYDVWREDFEFVTEKLVDKIDPPRFFPLIGPAQLHHCHWKCTIYYNETLEFASPVSFSFTRPQVEVIYTDRDRLYLWSPPTASKLASDDEE